MKRTIIQAATAAFLLGALPAAHAVPTLSLAVDGGAPIYCADGAWCDGNAAAGVVMFSQSMGDFVVNVTTGLSKPILSGGNPAMDLNTVNIQMPGGAHTLTIALSDTGFDLYGGRITMDYGGTLIGPGSVEHTAYYDDGNALFSQSMLIGSVGPYSNAFSGSVDGGMSPNGPYSLTEILTLKTGGDNMTVFSGDFAVKVPEPTTLALVALGLLGCAVASRRRRVPVRASRP